MAQLNVDPSKVEDLIRKFSAFASETENKEKQLKAYITNMQQYWNDNQYKAFLQQFQEFDQKIMRTLQEANTLIIPNLKNVKKLAEDYKNSGKR